MQYTTTFIAQLEELRAKHKNPTSLIERARHSVKEQAARAIGVEMPPLLTEEQRRVFLQNIDHLTGFLASEDGMDTIELLMDAFARYTETSQATPEIETVEPDPTLRLPDDDEESEPLE